LRGINPPVAGLATALGVLLAVCATPTMTVGHLLFSVAITRYILIGIQLEERNLVQQFGDRYRRDRQHAAMLVPLPGRKFAGPKDADAGGDVWRRVLRQINEPAGSNEVSAPLILLLRTTASTCIERASALTVEMFRAHILTLSKNDERDGNVGAAEKSAADACGHSGASAPVGRHVSAASGQGRAPVRGEPVAHPV
jgi:hypothetical protein